MKPLLPVLVALLPSLGVAADGNLGEQTFQEACAGCHGADAAGNGEKAPLLSVPVPDLTRIAARNDGVFDQAGVIRLIDGRTEIASHRGPMPMFGGLLVGPSVLIDGADGSVVSTSEPILAIVEWIETLQEP